VIAPQVTLTRDMLEKLFEKRERDCGRVFDRHDAFTEESYTFGAKMLVKIMASLHPRKRASDVDAYACATRRVAATLPLDFLALPAAAAMDVDGEGDEPMDVDDE